ncbi:MAG: ribonuclease P protein component [Candidatus Kapaibacteriota bacterium]
MKFRLESIRRKKEFEHLFSNGIRISHDKLRAIILFKNETELCTEKYKILYAVYVSKKATKKSVVRNRIKRLLRESLRLLARTEMVEKINVIKYLYLNWTSAPRRPCEIRLYDVFPLVHSIVEKAYNYFSKNSERSN